MDARDTRMLYFAIWAKQEAIVSRMKPLEIMDFMVERKVINFQERKLIDTEGRIKGDVRYNRLLLTHLMKKDEVNPGILNILMEGLADKKQTNVIRIIEEKIEEFKTGPSEDFFNDLRKLYLEIWTNMAPVPTDQYNLNLIERRLFMEPDFSAQIRFTEGQKKAWVERELQPACYRHHPLTDFETIFENHEKSSETPRLIAVTGDPGVGKTTLMRYYAIKWAQSKKNNQHTTLVKDSPIAKFKVVFYLPFASFGKHLKLVDMLLDPNMKYFQPYDRFMVELFLQDPSNLEQTVFILDGLDDVTLPAESEILKLISGEIHQGAKIVVCSRPYRACMQQIGDPDLIVRVKGFTATNTYQFMQQLFENEVPSERVDYLINKCRLLNTDIHLNPLCLNLICFTYQFHMTLGKLPEDFDLPQTKTRLFNAYFKMLLRLHLKKWNRSNEDCLFIKNPLSQDADIPSDLKHIIYVMCRLSFLALANEKHDFNEDDLQVNLLSSKTLKDIGLVCDISSSELKRYFFRHKMQAEHLAGIYLSMEGTRVPEYTRRLERGPKALLSDRLGRFHNMVCFAAGVSSVFFKELFKSATESCILKGLPDKDTFLQPQDVVIVLETQDPSVVDIFSKYLLDTELVNEYDEQDIAPTNYEWSAALFYVDNTDFNIICHLFERFYQLKLYPREHREDEESASRYEANVRIETVQKLVRGKYRNYENLDFQQCGLFFSAACTVITFENIRSIIIDDGLEGHSSTFLQLKDAVNSFPNVEEVELRKVNLYSTENRIGYLKDLLGELDLGDLDVSDDENEDEDGSGGHPLKSICFDQIHPNETVARDLKTLPQIETIQVLGSQIHESGFQTLATAIRYAPNMTRLALSGNKIGWHAWQLFKALAVTPELRELYLANCSLKDASEQLQSHMEAGTIDRLSNLQKLDISDNSITHRQFPVIDYFTTGNLRVLKLSGNHFGPAAVKVLHNLAEHDTLTDLQMDDCALDSGIETLQEAETHKALSKMHNIKALHLRNNWLQVGITDLMYYFFPNKIVVLHLSNNPLGEAAVDLLYILAEMGTVTELSLDNCNLDDAVETLEICTSPECENLLPQLITVQNLNIADNGLKTDCTPLLSYFITKKLKVLDISENPLGEATIFLLDNLAKYDSIRDLNLKGCDLQSAVEPLHDAMEDNAIQQMHRLKLVNISGNYLEYLSKGRPRQTFDKYFSSNPKLKVIRR